jgi:hypothetical protein
LTSQPDRPVVVREVLPWMWTFGSSEMDTKTGTCEVVPGRRPRGPALPEFVESYRRRAGIGN